MNFELLNLIPDEILNLIWRNVKPSIKYSINKYYLNKFYNVRFAFINNKNFKYNFYLTNYNYFIISNFKYLKYLIKNNCFIFFKIIMDYRLDKLEDFKNYELLFKKKINYENKTFLNIIDFSLYYSSQYKCDIIKKFIIEIIKKYNLIKLEKKWHKNNNNKLNKWTI